MPKQFAGLDLVEPRLMGIVNVTPDSFSDGGKFVATDAAIAHGLTLLKEGADILDIGGESTRPGASPVSLEEELARVIPVIEGLAQTGAPLISIDTRHAKVMEAALKAGAHIINDVSALTHDENSQAAVEVAQVPVILMHAKGTPADMQRDPQYEDVVGEVLTYLRRRAEGLKLPTEKIAIDPGIGFGKTL